MAQALQIAKFLLTAGKSDDEKAGYVTLLKAMAQGAAWDLQPRDREKVRDGFILVIDLTSYPRLQIDAALLRLVGSNVDQPDVTMTPPESDAAKEPTASADSFGKPLATFVQASDVNALANGISAALLRIIIDGGFQSGPDVVAKMLWQRDRLVSNIWIIILFSSLANIIAGMAAHQCT